MTTINQDKHYPHPTATVMTAAQGAVEGLGGKIDKENDELGQFEVTFDKKILGKVLGERTHLTAQIAADGDGSRATVSAYPLDAIGRPLQFGFRKGVTQTVVNWFFAHLEHRLPT